MIPGPFNYHRPASVGDAINLLASLGEEARPLAGGHSLIPMMKLRLATPGHLVDLHGVAGLKGIRRDGNRVVIGAMTTQHELLASDEIKASLPILQEAAALIADPQVRYRGTIGGNVANGDPGNDMPALMLTLGAAYRLEGPNGAREIMPSDFYQGAYFTALEPGEILTSITIPMPAAGDMIACAAAAAFFRSASSRLVPITALAASVASSGVSCRLVRPIAQAATLPPDMVSTTAAAAVA